MYPNKVVNCGKELIKEIINQINKKRMMIELMILKSLFKLESI